jgi:uncharacterized protein YkwD
MEPLSLKKALLALVAIVGCGCWHSLAPSSAWAQGFADGGGGMSSLDAQLSRSINAERTRAGVHILFPNEAVMRAAQSHARNMAVQGILDHQLDGERGGDRLRNNGYAYLRWSEAIASGYRTPAAAVAGWMKSAAHRDILLNGKMTHLGVGVATSANGTRYYCAVLAIPR